MIVRKINLKLLENCCFCLKAKKKKLLLEIKISENIGIVLRIKSPVKDFFLTQINFIHVNPLAVTISYQITTC
jgi:hypothetical protein